MLQNLINLQDLLESRGYVVDPIKTFSTGLDPKDRKTENHTFFKGKTGYLQGQNYLDTCNGPYWGDKPLPPFDRARVAMYKGQPPFDNEDFVNKLTSSTAMRSWNYKNTFCQIYEQSPKVNEYHSRGQERTFEVTTR